MEWIDPDDLLRIVTAAPNYQSEQRTRKESKQEKDDFNVKSVEGKRIEEEFDESSSDTGNEDERLKKRRRRKRLERNSCSICHKVYETSHHMKEHMKKVHMKLDLLKCDWCEESFTNTTSLKYHSITKHRREVHCQMCGNSFNNFTEYLKHRRNHYTKSHKTLEDEEKKECTICDKVVLTKNMRRHKDEVHKTHRINENTAPAEDLCVWKFKCIECGSIFKRKSNFETHMKNSHSKILKLVHCSLCTKSYKRKSDLTAHIRDKHSNNDYTCTRCGKRFSKKSNLGRHVKTCEKHPDTSDGDM